MKQQKKAFSLVIAMMIVLVSSLLAYTIIDFMLPFSKNIRGVENSVNAYYNANSGVEKALYFFKSRDGEYIKEDILSTSSIGDVLDSNGNGYKYFTESSGKLLPKLGEGNSEYGNNYNTIAMGEPIQLSIGNDFLDNLDDLEIQFKSPTIGTAPATLEPGTGYIAWQLSGTENAIYSDANNLIKGSEIDDDSINIGTKLKGVMFDTITGNKIEDIPLNTVYSSLGCETKKCILTFSVINELKTSGIPSKTLPFLEWKITSANEIPLRYSKIKSSGEYFGFGRILEVNYPQETLNQAFDFTVIQ